VPPKEGEKNNGRVQKLLITFKCFVNNFLIINSATLITLDPPHPHMSIISLSLKEDVITQLDKLEAEMNFSGRSETVRAAIRLLADEHAQHKKLQGIVNATLLVIHDEAHAEKIAEVRHKYLKIIRTQLHDHLEHHKCLELLMLRGDAQEIVKMTEEFNKSKSVTQVKLVIL
jgi:CopG family transcriptional regulator, nickel-responsive regulator